MVVTGIQENKKNKGRVSVYLDNEFSFACYKETLVDEGIYTGQQLEASDVERVRAADGAMYAWNSAVRYLSNGLHTQKQVEDKLRERGVEQNIIESTMERLRQYRLVDDEEFARLYAKKMYERYGRWAVVRKLREKGISKELADEVTQSAGDPEVLEKHVERLWHRYRSDAQVKRTDRIMRSMAARGFAFDDIRHAIQNLECTSGAGGGDEDF